MTNEELRLYVLAELEAALSAHPNLVAGCLKEFDDYLTDIKREVINPQVQVHLPFTSEHFAKFDEGATKAVTELEIYGRWFTFMIRLVKT